MLFFIIKNPKIQGLLMLKRILIKKDSALCIKVSSDSIIFLKMMLIFQKRLSCTKIPFDLSLLKYFFKQHVPLFCIVNCSE